MAAGHEALSVETTFLAKILCIFIDVLIVTFCTWGGRVASGRLAATGRLKRKLGPHMPRPITATPNFDNLCHRRSFFLIFVRDFFSTLDNPYRHDGQFSSTHPFSHPCTPFDTHTRSIPPSDRPSARFDRRLARLRTARLDSVHLAQSQSLRNRSSLRPMHHLAGHAPIHRHFTKCALLHHKHATSD